MIGKIIGNTIIAGILLVSIVIICIGVVFAHATVYWLQGNPLTITVTGSWYDGILNLLLIISVASPIMGVWMTICEYTLKYFFSRKD